MMGMLYLCGVKGKRKEKPAKPMTEGNKDILREFAIAFHFSPLTFHIIINPLKPKNYGSKLQCSNVGQSLRSGG